ncbi:hypothetical protein KM176_18490 [Pseudooceanicola sp. CBS1P-1]|uniref:Tetratricopeptide repeat protein n=1 Tax=Pseudooceanicola albus TaxID=2692189 RepID=A0A6L7G941_9RHOB|nr:MULTISPECIES: hypothetical protein [Pseudooceanicola]MBT9385866.1 hypothetical protein [Pseudooceanicola endophyticus]MXN20097.1 hypothetical protein [Pseudooceanicola albus]
MSGRLGTGLLALLLMLLPGLALAQVSVVRAGDHAAFTRLTISLPRGTTWDLVQSPGRATVSLSGTIQSIDISQVFERIQRDRLREVTVEPGQTLTLELACLCRIEPSTYGTQLLILDLRDGPPLPQRPDISMPLADRPLADPRANLSLAQPVPPQMPALPAMPPPDPPEGAMATDPTSAPPPPEIPAPLRSFAEARVNALPDLPAPLSETEERLARQLEDSLLRAIGGAATEGLLQTDPRGAAALSAEERSLPASDDTATADPGVAALTATLEDAQPGPSNRFVLSGDDCALAMPPTVSTEETGAFSDQLARLRSALVGEFDRPDPRAHLELAQFYISQGFGAEARSVLDALALDTRETREMASVARILEYGHDPQDNPFASRTDCDSEAALWGILALDPLPPGQDIDTVAVKRAMMTLPDPLKRYLGPILAQRFVSIDEGDTARDLMRVLERETEITSPRQEMVAARLESQDSGQPDRTAYHEIIANNDDVSAEALLHYTEDTLAGGKPVDPETIGLLESFRAQYRDTPIEAGLTRTEIAAHSSTGNFTAAYDLFEAAQAEMTGPDRAKVADSLARNLSMNASDAAFARLYFRHTPLIRDGIPPETANLVADRLLSLGFLDEAAGYLAPGAEGDAGRSRRLMRARLALAQNLPRQAEGELTGLTGRDADRLRAELRLKTNDFLGAETLFRAIGETEAADSAALLARDWSTLQSSQAAPGATLADVVTTQEAAPVDLPALGPPSLTASRDALSQSAETRNALQKLLSTLQVDTALDQ